jgi:predicted dehydrogenase
MTRVGVVGLAHVHAAGYADVLAALDGVEFVGASEPDASLRSRWADESGLPAFPEHGALIDAGIDAAIISTATNEHRPVVEQLAGRGIHVLCEKPLATTREDAQAIVRACDVAGVLLMTAFPMRFSLPLIEGAAWINEDRIGSVLAFTGTNNGCIPTDHAAWFADPVAAGGGAVMDHTVHLVDIMRWWLRSEPTEIFAETNQVLHPGAEVETGGILTVTFDNGVIATIDCSWSRPTGYPTWGGLSIEAVGTDGVFAVDPFAERLEMWTRGNATWVDWGADSNLAMIDHFIGAVQGEHRLLVTGVDGLRATEAALAAYRSAEIGQPVRLDPLAPGEPIR